MKTWWRIFAVLFVVPILAGHATAETMPTVKPVEKDPRIRLTIGEPAFCLTASTSKMQWSPDGKWILANVANESRVAQFDATTGLLERQLKVDETKWMLSTRGDLFAGVTGKYPNIRLVGWKFPSMEKLWEVPIGNNSLAIAVSADGSRAAVLYPSYFSPLYNTGKSVPHVGLIDTAAGRVITDVPLSEELSSHWFADMKFAKEKYLMIAFKSTSRPVAVVDVEAGKEVTEEFLAGKQGDLGSVEQVAFSPKGDAVVLIDPAGCAVWRMDGKQPPEQVISDSSAGYDPEVMFRQGEFSADGSRMAIASCEGCRLYDVATGQMVKKFTGAQEVHFSPDGKQLLLLDGTRMHLLSIETGERIDPLTAVQGTLCKMAFQQNGSLVAATDCLEIFVWDTKDGHLVARLPRPDTKLCVEALLFHPNDRYLICGDGQRLWAWDLDGVAADASGPATSARRGGIFHWDNMPGQLYAFSIHFADGGRSALVVRQRRAWFLTMDPDPTIRALKFREMTLDGLGNDDWLSSVQLSPQGDWLAAGTQTGLRIYKLNPDFFQTELKIKEAHAFSPDGKWCVYRAGSTGGDLTLASLPEGKIETVLPLSQEADSPYRYPRSTAFSDDSKYLAVAAYDNMISWNGFYLWEMGTYKKLDFVETPGGNVKKVAFGNGGHSMAILNSNNTITVWSTDALVSGAGK